MHAQWNAHEKKWLAEHADEAETYRAMKRQARAGRSARSSSPPPRRRKTDATRSARRHDPAEGGGAGAVARRWRRRSRRLDQDADQGLDQGRARASSTGATCTSAFASTRWARWPTAFAYYGMFIPFTRDVPHLQRLHAAVDPPGGAVAAAGRARLHARLGVPRRGRADAPAGRARLGAAADPERARVASRRRASSARRRGPRRSSARDGPSRADPVAPEGGRAAAGHAAPTTRARGGYVILREEGGAPDVVFMATGSEVGVAVEAARELRQGRHARARRLAAVPRGLRRAGRRAGATRSSRRRACASRSKPAAPICGRRGSAPTASPSASTTSATRRPTK